MIDANGRRNGLINRPVGIDEYQVWLVVGEQNPAKNQSVRLQK
ncbi:hypothetical protein [Gibbsiella quercinecans]|nr:hypothetical protein [Gibbsiella quercinecans]